MTEPELYPCPFCGAPAFLMGPLENEYWVNCTECDAVIGMGAPKEQAIAQWNRRPVEKPPKC